MSTPDSSTGGFLAPLEQLADDAALDLLFQPVIVGITGLDGTLVRRKGQEVPGAQPARETTWCAFAATTTQSDTNPSLVHDPHADGGLGRDIELRSETIEVTASFYGPAAIGSAKILRDGLDIPQNREAMRAQGLAYVDLVRITFVPDLQNGQMIRRGDVVFRVRRMVVRSYAIRNILSIDGAVITDVGGPAGPTTVFSPFETEA